MRSNVAYLVLLMLLLAVLAVVQLHPLSLLPLPGNLFFGLALLGGAVAVALRRPWSYPVGLGAAALTVLGGMLSTRAYLYTSLPASPIVWMVVGLYLAFRLTMNHHAAEQQAARRQKEVPR